MFRVDMITRAMADLDPANLPATYVRCIRYYGANGDLVTLTRESDIKDFLKRDNRFAGFGEAQVIPDFDRIEREWLEEIAWIKERVTFLLSKA